MRCFSSPGWLGYSGIKARLAAPPDFSQSSTPFSLLAPRHPPHALTSLAAPPNTPHARHRTREASGDAPILCGLRMTTGSSEIRLLRLVSRRQPSTALPSRVYAPCGTPTSPRFRGKRPSIRCYSHTTRCQRSPKQHASRHIASPNPGVLLGIEPRSLTPQDLASLVVRSSTSSTYRIDPVCQRYPPSFPWIRHKPNNRTKASPSARFQRDFR